MNQVFCKMDWIRRQEEVSMEVSGSLTLVCTESSSVSLFLELGICIVFGSAVIRIDFNRSYFNKIGSVWFEDS